MSQSRCNGILRNVFRRYRDVVIRPQQIGLRENLFAQQVVGEIVCDGSCNGRVQLHR